MPRAILICEMKWESSAWSHCDNSFYSCKKSSQTHYGFVKSCHICNTGPCCTLETTFQTFFMKKSFETWLNNDNALKSFFPLPRLLMNPFEPRNAATPLQSKKNDKRLLDSPRREISKDCSSMRSQKKTNKRLNNSFQGYWIEGPGFESSDHLVSQLRLMTFKSSHKEDFFCLIRVF